ncbi:AI-2E family transporter [Halobacteriaceae archaeon GCM10025711]
MTLSRRRTLTVLLVLALAVAGVVLFRVLGTVFFAVTVAYVLVPLHRRLTDRGLSEQWASAAASLIAALAALVPATAAGYLLYRRRDAVLAFIRSVPETYDLDLFGAVVTVDITTLLVTARTFFVGFLGDVARALPVLALKFSLFAILVFALLLNRGDTRRALLSPVPPRYHDVVTALHERVRDTLYAIYVLQAASAVVTGLFAYPVFLLFGYPFAGTLALFTAVLQFLPIVGPSVVVVVLVLYELSVGAVVKAVLVLVLGLVIVAALPDLVVRVRLAAETTRMPGSLYFVGFVGGLLTVGPVGIIAGPLAVALLAEVLGLLSAEMNADGATTTRS